MRMRRGSGVERVLEQFLDDGGGALDDFAGGDLVGDQVGENADTAHELIVRVGGSSLSGRGDLMVRCLCMPTIIVIVGLGLWLAPFVRTGWNRSAPAECGSAVALGS